MYVCLFVCLSIFWEEPYAGLYNQVIKLPPIALTYPLQKPQNLTPNELLTEQKFQLALKLKYFMCREGYDPDKYEFDTSFGGRRNIYGEECPICHYTPENHFDDICAEYAMAVEVADAAKAAEVADAAEANGSSNLATEELSLSFYDLLLAHVRDIPDSKGV